MAAYIKTVWVDHIKDDETGEVLQEGTRFTAKRMNKIEDGIFDINAKDSLVLMKDGNNIPIGERNKGVLYFKATEKQEIINSNLKVSPNMGIVLT